MSNSNSKKFNVIWALNQKSRARWLRKMKTTSSHNESLLEHQILCLQLPRINTVLLSTIHKDCYTDRKGIQKGL